ncbi:MAG: hypothetical protein ACLQBX_18775 [Candidatus Limnocylindrales bacterium]
MTGAHARRVRAAQGRAWVLLARRLSTRYGLPEDDARALAYWRATDARKRVLGRPLMLDEAAAIAGSLYGVALEEVLAEARGLAEERAGGEAKVG